MWNYRTKLKINRPAELFPVSWVNITGAKIATALTRHVSLSGQERTCYLSMSLREPWHWFWHVLCITLSKLDPWSGEDLSAQVIHLKNNIFIRNSNTMVMITVLMFSTYALWRMQTGDFVIYMHSYEEIPMIHADVFFLSDYYCYFSIAKSRLWTRLCVYKLYTLINSLYSAHSIDNHQSDVLKN